VVSYYRLASAILRLVSFEERGGNGIYLQVEALQEGW